MSEVNRKTYRNLINGTFVVLIYAAIIAYYVYDHDLEFQSTEESQIWVQPDQISTQPLISPNNSEINFAALEKALLEMRFNKTGNLELNSNTADLLKDAVKHIPEDVTDTELDRLHFLIRSIHPQHINNQLVDILFKYQEYSLIASQQNYKKNRSTTIEEAKNNFNVDLQLKKQYLGEKLTNDLFSERHAMTRFILKSREILANQKLTNAQKERLLISVRKELKS